MLEFFIVLLVVLLLWTPFFNYMTRNTSHRIIKRGEGYTIQSKTFFKWSDIVFDDGESIIFKTKEDAAEVLILARNEANKK